VVTWVDRWRRTQPPSRAKRFSVWDGLRPDKPAASFGSTGHHAGRSGELCQVTIGGVDAPVAYAGLVEAGLYQFNVTVPSVPTGTRLWWLGRREFRRRPGLNHHSVVGGFTVPRGLRSPRGDCVRSPSDRRERRCRAGSTLFPLLQGSQLMPIPRCELRLRIPELRAERAHVPRARDVDHPNRQRNLARANAAASFTRMMSRANANASPLNWRG